MCYTGELMLLLASHASNTNVSIFNCIKEVFYYQKVCNLNATRKPTGSKMVVLQAHLHINIQPPVTLTFDLLSCKVDRFMLLSRGSLAPVWIHK